jgi:WhiB family transcriptional regulator, redox-sensing transcriptional regulator
VSTSDTGWDWRTSARCRADEPGPPVDRDLRSARAFCAGCVVRTECLGHALDNRLESGIWGGTSPRERRAHLRARLGVGSWAALLASGVVRR